MADPSPAQLVADLPPKLRGERLCYFPIRHHSPACAAHLRRWIEARRPASVLVEGPASFTSYIDLLTDERCVSPVALYTTFLDKRGRLSGKAPDGEEAAGPALGPPRHAAYYPFCDYSPELVALRAGRAVEAALRFIDLEYPEMVLARGAADPDEGPEGVRVDSLAADPHLLHSAYVRALAQRLGCRDFNELWDHLFEANEDANADAFIDRLAAYCALARFDYTPDVLRRDGTTAREACMAAAIRAEVARNEAEGRTGPVLVVTGGFHTVVLPDLVAAGASRPAPPALADDEAGTWLMRYSFDQLDALSGYASGMPSPAYYDLLWRSPPDGDGARLAADVIVGIGRLAREKGLPSVISTPDVIAAVQTARQLASLRGHRRPLREDVLDGIRSCFVKGEMAVDGQLVMRLVHEVLAGDRVGRLPPGTAVPPIVADFQREARRCRLPIDSVERREMTLDLYRNANHRRTSRLFHRLDLLGAPFAVFVSGPDFVQGQGLDRMQEHWQVCWSPATESALIEASVYGPTIEEAAAARLRRLIAQLEDEGQGRNAAAAVALLVRACRLGLHRQTAALVPLIDGHIADDPSFPSVTAGLSQLELLADAREPLEAAHLTALPRLTETAYRRACRLLNDAAGCPDEQVDAVLGAVRTLREVLAASRRPRGTAMDPPGRPALDPDLFHQALRRAADHAPDHAQAAVVGAAVGVLYGEGLFSEEELVRATLGYLGAAADPRKGAGVLRHHNGAFRLSYGFEYAVMMETNKERAAFAFNDSDTYDWYLKLGSLAHVNETYLHGNIPSWNDFANHPSYDSFWQKQAVAPYVDRVTVPTLSVAGWWDQEDFYGPIKIYELLEKHDTKNLNFLVVGPWNHGGWGGQSGRQLGNVDFGSETSPEYRRGVLAPFFAYWLKGIGTQSLPEATVFEGGSNTWQKRSSWPLKTGVTPRRLYVQADRKLSFSPPADRSPNAADSFVSDPANPVPYRPRPILPTYGQGSTWSRWLTDDQRFLDNRPDVISWQTDPLDADVTIAGDITAHLFASTTGSDADWVVKLIDVYPDTGQADPKLNGYQLMVANDVFRGRFRKGFDHPEAITPNHVDEYVVDLHTQDYKFRKGHRIMVEVQSSWFPLIDRNPQTYVTNIFQAKDSDFKAQTHRIFRSSDAATYVQVSVVNANAK